MRQLLAPIRRAGRILARAWTLPLADRIGIVRMLGLATTIEIGLRTVRLPALARGLGVRLDWSKDPSSPPGIPNSLDDTDRRELTNVIRVMRHWPFAEGTCLRQSLMLGRVLRDRNPLLRIGVKGRDGEIVAHAWVEMDGVALGGRDGYLPLGGFEVTRPGDER